MEWMCLLCNSREEEELIINIIFIRLDFIRTSLKTLTGRREIKFNLNLFHGLLFPLEMYIWSFGGSDLTDRRLLIWVSLTLVLVTYTEILNVQDRAVTVHLPVSPGHSRLESSEPLQQQLNCILNIWISLPVDVIITEHGTNRKEYILGAKMRFRCEIQRHNPLSLGWFQWDCGS